ncbi:MULTISPECIES: hypothetical protein [Streptomyces]|uniref:hypothetical protein n=1 Tax=Streptomyces TaxID=1883 RepID=UPI002248B1C2|nr:hypothetical protein [Streptomyces sp. JHD 1]MCX2970512.1 hypothetical protein [Streptomyces sp. JHD 1]
MSEPRDTPPGPDARHRPPDGAPGEAPGAAHGDPREGSREDTARTERTELPGATYRDNQQRVEHGVAFTGAVYGDFHHHAATEEILKPALREGPYPADEIAEKLRGFVEPPAHLPCRKALDRRVLLLGAEGGTGASTAAFALLAERHGTSGVTGLDPAEDLARWRPGDRRGYLLQGLPQDAADALGEVALRALADLLRQAGAHLVVTVRAGVRLPVDALPWHVAHLPPSPRDVAVRRLHAWAREGRLTGAHLSDALGRLASRPFADHLRGRSLPGDGVEVAAELREVVVTGKPVTVALESLRQSDPGDRTALDDARGSADALSLLAAVALLPRQDRTVVERFAATLRPLLHERAPTDPASARPERPDVLGPAFEDRLARVGARPLPREPGAARRYRYAVQPVAFFGRHRSEVLLRRLWLDYEGMAELLWRALAALPDQPGVDLAAGQAIGRVLTHATGPDALRQLGPFAASERRWQRRLVAYALGELAQHAEHGGAVREQLRQWSRRRSAALRCTVAETCAGSYGLAHPRTALRLLDAVLDGPEADAEGSLWTAVSFALSVLLSEEPNHAPVLDRMAAWLAAEPGTLRHAFAAHAVQAMARSTFPLPGRSGPRKVALAEVLGDHPRQALALVTLALDTPATFEAVADGLLAIERDPHLRHRAACASFLAALSHAAAGRRGLTRLVLRRHRAHATTAPSTSERTAS